MAAHQLADLIVAVHIGSRLLDERVHFFQTTHCLFGITSSYASNLVSRRTLPPQWPPAFLIAGIIMLRAKAGGAMLPFNPR